MSTQVSAFWTNDIRKKYQKVGKNNDLVNANDDLFTQMKSTDPTTSKNASELVF
jgi:hypothetical protein